MKLALPLKITEHPESFGITDSIGTHVAYIYFEDNASRRNLTKRLDRAAALEVAKVTARALTDKATADQLCDPRLSTADGNIREK